MFDFYEKRKIKSWLYSKTMIAVLLVPIVLLSMSVAERFEKERDTKEKRAERARELENIEKRAAALEVTVEEVESERGIEEEIRSRYDVAKEGEQVVIIFDEEDQNESDGPRAEIIEEDDEGFSFFDRLKFW